jgi:hypothetical protein
MIDILLMASTRSIFLLLVSENTAGSHGNASATLRRSCHKRGRVGRLEISAGKNKMPVGNSLQ